MRPSINVSFAPIALNLVLNLQAANPDHDLCVLIAHLEDWARVERREIDRKDVECPKSSKLYSCLDLALPIVADRIVAQPKAWKLLLPAAKLLFQLYLCPALSQMEATGKPRPTFRTYRQFLRWMGPMDQIAKAVGRTTDSQILAQARQQIADFTTDVLQTVAYHQALRGASNKVFYRKTRRESAAPWLRLAYSVLDEKFGIKTHHHPLAVLLCAERSAPGAKGMLVQHGFAVSLIFPTGPAVTLPEPLLQSLVARIPNPQLHALRAASKVWPDRASYCSHCAADLTHQPKRRACKACSRPAYCGPECQRACVSNCSPPTDPTNAAFSDWALKHREICAVWVAVNERMRVPSVKRALAKQAVHMDLQKVLVSTMMAPV